MLTNKFVEHSSRWGNGYIHRYFIDGKRVGKTDFDYAANSADLTAEESTSERIDGVGYRTTWVKQDQS